VLRKKQNGFEVNNTVKKQLNLKNALKIRDLRQVYFKIDTIFNILFSSKSN